MTQPPATGPSPYSPQGPNPYGSQPAQPYGAPQSPYGASPGSAQPPSYGQPVAPQQPAANPYTPQQPSANPYPPQQPSPTPQTPQYGQQQSPQAPQYGQPTPTPQYGVAQGAPYGQAAPPTQQPSQQQPSQQQPSQGQYGQQPYVPGQTAQTGWTGASQAYTPPTGFPPAPPAKKSKTGLIVVGVVAALALVFGGGYLVYRASQNKAVDVVVIQSTPAMPTSAAAPSTTQSSSPTTRSSSPSASASGNPGFRLSGSTLTGVGVTATLPAGWKLSPTNGGENEGQIIDANRNYIEYYSGFSRNAAANCAHQAEWAASAAGVESSDPPVTVDGVTWAGSPAVAITVTMKRASQTEREVLGYYCVDHNGDSYALRSIAWDSDAADVVTGAKALLASWKWQ